MNATEEKKPSTFWLKAIIGALLIALGFVLGLWAGCAQKKKPSADFYAERINSGWVNIFIHALSGVKPVTYHEVQPETTILLDTVYVSREVSKFWGIGRVNLNPAPAPSFVQYMRGGRAYEDKFFADTGLNYTYRIWQDSTGVHWQEAALDISSLKTRRTILAVVFTGGAQYGQIDTLWRVRPEFEASLKWNIATWLYAKAGLRFPWGVFLNLTGEFPLITKEK